MANMAVLESGGVISMSSALHFPLEVSEQAGDDRGAWYGAVSDATAMREKEGINAEAAVFAWHPSMTTERITGRRRRLRGEEWMKTLAWTWMKGVVKMRGSRG